jgi:hypothetical protein
VDVALRLVRKDLTLAQRIVEILIGRLVTDEQFRTDFLAAPETTLVDYCTGRGLDLSHTEIAALLATDRALWGRTADALDGRLQKASLTHQIEKGESRHV